MQVGKEWNNSHMERKEMHHFFCSHHAPMKFRANKSNNLFPSLEPFVCPIRGDNSVPDGISAGLLQVQR